MSDFTPTHRIGRDGPECEALGGTDDMMYVRVSSGCDVSVLIKDLIPIAPPAPDVEARWIVLKTGGDWHSFESRPDILKNLITSTLDPRYIPTVEDLAGMGLFICPDRMNAPDGTTCPVWRFVTDYLGRYEGPNKATATGRTVDEARIAAANWLRTNKPEVWSKWRESKKGGDA